MAGKVTIQDTADALGLSKNTVSKAINTSVLAKSAKEKTLQKAVLSIPPVQDNKTTAPEKPFASHSSDYAPLNGAISSSFPSGKNFSGPRVIALLTGTPLGSSHFSSTMLDKFQMELTLLGYELVIYRISPMNIEKMTLPALIKKDSVSGIICFEIFHPAYSSMICELGIPTLFVDAPVAPCNTTLKADRLMMENRSNIYALVQEMVHRGKKRIGFAGQPFHCLSFYERYMAYREALFMLDLPSMEKYCLFINDSTGFASAKEYQQYLAEQLNKMKELPDVFICANDFVALDVMNRLRAMNVSVPEDIFLCGFDDSSESRIITPRLTTVHIHSQIMGWTAVQLLMSRIAEPTLNYRTVYTETTLIYRESTGD